MRRGWTQNPYYPSDPPWRAPASGVRDWIGGACLLVHAPPSTRLACWMNAFFMKRRGDGLVLSAWQQRLAGVVRGRCRCCGMWAAPAPIGVRRASACASMKGSAVFVEKHYGRMAGGIVAQFSSRLTSPRLVPTRWPIS